jgi:hypothetical protein
VTVAKSYGIFSWDHEGDGWRPEATAPTPMRLRAKFRELCARGYDDTSVLVCSSDWQPDLAAGPEGDSDG